MMTVTLGVEGMAPLMETPILTGTGVMGRPPRAIMTGTMIGMGPLPHTPVVTTGTGMTLGPHPPAGIGPRDPARTGITGPRRRLLRLDALALATPIPGTMTAPHNLLGISATGWGRRLPVIFESHVRVPVLMNGTGITPGRPGANRGRGRDLGKARTALQLCANVRCGGIPICTGVAAAVGGPTPPRAAAEVLVGLVSGTRGTANGPDPVASRRRWWTGGSMAISEGVWRVGRSSLLRPRLAGQHQQQHSNFQLGKRRGGVMPSPVLARAGPHMPLRNMQAYREGFQAVSISSGHCHSRISSNGHRHKCSSSCRCRHAQQPNGGLHGAEVVVASTGSLTHLPRPRSSFEGTSLCRVSHRQPHLHPHPLL